MKRGAPEGGLASGNSTETLRCSPGKKEELDDWALRRAGILLSEVPLLLLSSFFTRAGMLCRLISCCTASMVSFRIIRHRLAVSYATTTSGGRPTYHRSKWYFSHEAVVCVDAVLYEALGVGLDLVCAVFGKDGQLLKEFPSAIPELQDGGLEL
eukprot:CAMPEP_0168541652 /NCGR_PEP_ID=MMETSP0413-20121227/932_1 /TAXON_ID=136452 /ORGANISM="Filamoeba nolandi, Strain NC-AS-23-1" /LENGTH=153 /DNA_ID=CAMNT_0008571483 /DNA_START=113 /DNA_END=571 /DNA_ORIENTATION=+